MNAEGDDLVFLGTGEVTQTYVAMLNKGLTEMRKTGEWYDIVATGLEEYNKLKQQ